MAAFAVIFHKNGHPVSTGSVDRMRQSLRVLGPDRDNVATHGRFGFSWTFNKGYTPQDIYEFQPVSAGDRWQLVFIGFLMHREELGLKLAITGQILEKTPDSALVLAAWEKWGDACVSHLYGTYSFVVCDTNRQELVAVRGSERGATIYCHEDSDRIILSTSTKAIFCFPDIAKEIDETRIADALVLNYEDRDQSYYKDISIIPSGHILRANPDSTDIRRYYHLQDIPDIRFGKDSDYVDAARELLENAVSSSLRANETPALSLSAGLDSTTIAVTMIDLLREQKISGQLPVKAFVSVPDSNWDDRVRPGRMGDESGPVRELMKIYPDLDVEFVNSIDLAFDHGLDDLQSYADMPIRGVGNLHAGVDISRKCREAGRRVCLSGVGGNGSLSFSGASVYFGMWFRQGRWLKLLRENNAYNRVLYGNQGKYFRRLLGRALLPNLPGPVHDLVWKTRTGQKTLGFSAFSAIHPDYAREMDVENRMKQKNWDDRYRTPSNRREMVENLLVRGARDEGGGISEADKAMTGIESRDPLGDRKIAEFCLGIPDEQFFKDGVDRRLIKRMMAGRLPQAVCNAPRGEQSADWHGRMAKDLVRIDAELERLADDPVMSKRLDIERMRSLIKAWPEKTPLSAADHPDFMIARYAIGRALSISRFINKAEGKNY